MKIFRPIIWVRDLRAAGGEATITRTRRTEKIRAVELPPEGAAPIFREAVRSGPPGIPAAKFAGIALSSSSHT